MTALGRMPPRGQIGTDGLSAPILPGRPVLVAVALLVDGGTTPRIPVGVEVTPSVAVQLAIPLTHHGSIALVICVHKAIAMASALRTCAGSSASFYPKDFSSPATAHHCRR